MLIDCLCDRYGLDQRRPFVVRFWGLKSYTCIFDCTGGPRALKGQLHSTFYASCLVAVLVSKPHICTLTHPHTRVHIHTSTRTRTRRQNEFTCTRSIVPARVAGKAGDHGFQLSVQNVFKENLKYFKLLSGFLNQEYTLFNKKHFNDNNRL